MTFQRDAFVWAQECFGAVATWAKTRERANRFIEEALELCQALNMSREDAHQIVDYVYNRPKGEPFQETGGVMVTLAVLCSVCGPIDMDVAAQQELDRCWQKLEVIRKKQATKKLDSALPQDEHRQGECWCGGTHTTHLPQ